MKRPCTLTFAALFSAWFLHAASEASAKEPPNIVIIYADDLGYGDVQCYNSSRGKIATPHIDGLAKSGLRFTDAHSSSGVCSPSRYTLLTGRYHWRTRLQSGIVGLWGSPLIARDRLTIGSIAQSKGYVTACIGKWHLGWNWPIAAGQRPLLNAPDIGKGQTPQPSEKQRQAWKRIFSQPIGGGPTTRGFDCYFGTDVPNWPPYCFIENDRTVGIPSEFLAIEKLRKNQASRQGPAVENWSLEPILPALGERAAKFIRESADGSKPFLLYLPLTSPHTPLSVNSSWRNKSGLNLYADFVMETDAVVGGVLKAIDDAGVADKTFVVFTSDNGCAPYIGVPDLEKKGHFPSGPLRGYKSDTWEGGHRVPFIVRWPGVVAPGRASKQLVHQADLLATLADICEIELPANAGEDSFSLAPLLKGSDALIREHSVSCSIRGVPSFRSGPWKLIPAAGSGGWTQGGGDQPVQLYNLHSDLAEKHNLAAVEPKRFAAMKAQFERVIAEGRSTPGPRQPNDVRVRRFP